MQVITTGMTKEQVMRLVYNDAEYQRVDPAFPFDAFDEEEGPTPQDRFWFVMDYNVDSVFGRLTDLRELARERGMEFIAPYKQGQFLMHQGRLCVADNAHSDGQFVGVRYLDVDGSHAVFFDAEYNALRIGDCTPIDPPEGLAAFPINKDYCVVVHPDGHLTCGCQTIDKDHLADLVTYLFTHKLF